MPYLTLRDGAELFYKDWGNPNGAIVTFSHGWPLSSDNWESQMMYLGGHGYRVIAHDRRGHGRSSQTWNGNNMDNFVDDLEELFAHLKVKDAVMVGHSHGGGEVTRYLGKHGTGRFKKAVLIGAVPPLMLKTSVNTKGTEKSVFDSFREAILKDRAQFFLDVPSGPFFGFNRPGAQQSEGQIRNWWRQGMNTSCKSAYDSIKDFSETDFTEDLKKIDIPVLVLHGDDDQVVPIEASGLKSAELLPQEVFVEEKSEGLPADALFDTRVAADCWSYGQLLSIIAQEIGIGGVGAKLRAIGCDLTKAEPEAQITLSDTLAMLEEYNLEESE